MMRPDPASLFGRVEKRLSHRFYLEHSYPDPAGIFLPLLVLYQYRVGLTIADRLVACLPD